MMDNSDGLALSMSDLAEVSGVGFVVRDEALPIAEGIEDMVGHKEAMNIVLRAGGDHELVFSVKLDMLEAAKKACDLTAFII
jgi:thiamine-monophosphate kinase